MTFGSSFDNCRKHLRSVRRESAKDIGIPAIVLRPRDRMSVTESIQLLRIQGEDVEASLEERFHDRTARDLDGHRDLRSFRWERLDEPIQSAIRPMS